MKLDYATLISPYPFYLQGVGNIKAPTLKEIWKPDITYQKYNFYLTLLLMTPQTFLEQIGAEKTPTILSENIDSLSMMDLISSDKSLQKQYCDMYDFFFEENVIWDDDDNAFFIYKDVDESGNIIPTGVIYNENFYDVCDVILQRCRVDRNKKVERPKFRNKITEKIWLKTQKNKEIDNKDMELPNIISAYSAFGNGYNITNIWDMTVFQLYDQFQRQRMNTYFNISSMSVAAWGNSDNHFDIEEWYKKI